MFSIHSTIDDGRIVESNNQRYPYLPTAPFGRDKRTPSGFHSCSSSSTISDTFQKDSAVTACTNTWIRERDDGMGRVECMKTSCNNGSIT